jgi:hypothetical protein
MSLITQIFLEREGQSRNGEKEGKRERTKDVVFTIIDANFYVKTSKIKQPYILI